jgi:hypothetical protein
MMGSFRANSVVEEHTESWSACEPHEGLSLPIFDTSETHFALLKRVSLLAQPHPRGLLYLLCPNPRGLVMCKASPPDPDLSFNKLTSCGFMNPVCIDYRSQISVQNHESV